MNRSVLSPTLATSWLVVLVFTTGCRQDMHDQPRYEPLQASDFFRDRMSARPLVAGTVARGHLNDTQPQFTGVSNDGRFLDTVPVALTRGVVERGRERFEIYCSPCHGRAGDGYGMIALRGLHGAPSLLTDRIRREPPGYIFAVISNGFGAMPDYAEQIVPNDRWAIITYVRALQLSRPEAAK